MAIMEFKEMEVVDKFKLDFGSCSKQNQNQEIFESIHKRNPDLFIWLGDAIYIDIRADTKEEYKKNVPHFFSLTKNNQFYKKLLNSKTEILGTWDDHDSAGDNSDASYDLMKFTKPHFLDFIDEPKNSDRYLRDKGVYDVKYYKIKKGKKSLLLQVLLLDVRSFSTRKGPKGEVLGTVQWEWLESHLKDFSSYSSSSSVLTVIGSGTQILQTGKFLPGFEFWAQYGSERSRFLNLLQKYKNLNYILLSGDVHFGEISSVNCILDYPLFEVTSSGLTHYHAKHIRPFLDVNHRNHENKRYKFRNSGELEIDLDSLNNNYKNNMNNNNKDEAGIKVGAYIFDVDGNKKIEQQITFDRKECTKAELEEQMKTVKNEETYFTTKLGWWAQEAVQLTNTIWYQVLYDYFYDIVKFIVGLVIVLLYVGVKVYW